MKRRPEDCADAAIEWAMQHPSWVIATLALGSLISALLAGSLPGQ